MKSNLAQKQLLSIGEVISALSNDFPDLSISKIRFLESEGLISPLRAPSGYRKFTHFDRDRIRYILELQYQHYLPLRVIKEHLDNVDAGVEKPIRMNRKYSLVEKIADVRNRFDQVDSPIANVWLTIPELATMCHCSGDLIKEVAEVGLISLRGEKVHAGSKGIIEIVMTLAELGVPIKHLRALKLTTERQIALAETVSKPIRERKARQADQRADELVLEILNKFSGLNQLLIAEYLRDQLS